MGRKSWTKPPNPTWIWGQKFSHNKPKILLKSAKIGQKLTQNRFRIVHEKIFPNSCFQKCYCLKSPYLCCRIWVNPPRIRWLFVTIDMFKIYGSFSVCVVQLLIPIKPAFYSRKSHNDTIFRRPKLPKYKKRFNVFLLASLAPEK